MKRTVKIIAAMLSIAMLMTFASCGKKTEKKKENKKDVNVYVLTGPTGIGAVKMWDNAENEKGYENYHFKAVSAPDEIVAKLSNGEADIAAISTNLAAKLYKKTNGGIKILAVNTLGVLNVLDNTGAEISSLADIKGRNIVTTGQGANPEYIINYLLKANGIDPEKDVSISFKAEGSELAAVWATDPEAVIIAPQPVATSITMKYEGSANVLSLTDEWRKVSPESELAMGCIVARTEFLEKNPEIIEKLLLDYGNSTVFANEVPEITAQLCEKYGIVAKAAIAAEAIPNCSICCYVGEEMEKMLTGYLQVLFSADPSSIGGEMPDDGIWAMIGNN